MRGCVYLSVNDTNGIVARSLNIHCSGVERGVVHYTEERGVRMMQHALVTVVVHVVVPTKEQVELNIMKKMKLRSSTLMYPSTHQ